MLLHLRSRRVLRALSLALSITGVGSVVPTDHLSAQTSSSAPFQDVFSDERPTPIFRRTGSSFRGDLTTGSTWSTPATQPSIFDPTPLGPLGAPSSELKPGGAQAATREAAPEEGADHQQPARAPAENRKPSGKAVQPAKGKQEPASVRLVQPRQPAQSLGRGVAAWYEHPGKTASGEVYNPDGLTAAHRTLPFGTRVRVVNPRNGRSVVVRINDRNAGPKQIAIDLSRGSARRLGIEGIGTVAMSIVSVPDQQRVPVAQASP